MIFAKKMKPGEKIKELIAERGIKQKELPELLGFSKGYVSQIVNNVRKPSRNFWVRLMLSLKLKPDDILLDEALCTPDTEEPYERKEVFVEVRYCPNINLLDKDWSQESAKCPSISIPVSAAPLAPRVGHSYIMIKAAEETGMDPTISTGDLVMIDLTDTGIRERKVYLVKYKEGLLFRYVTRIEEAGVKGYFLNARDPAFGTVFLKEDIEEKDLILGQALWVFKPLK